MQHPSDCLLVAELLLDLEGPIVEIQRFVVLPEITVDDAGVVERFGDASEIASFLVKPVCTETERQGLLGVAAIVSDEARSRRGAGHSHLIAELFEEADSFGKRFEGAFMLFESPSAAPDQPESPSQGGFVAGCPGQLLGLFGIAQAGFIVAQSVMGVAESIQERELAIFIGRRGEQIERLAAEGDPFGRIVPAIGLCQLEEQVEPRPARRCGKLRLELFRVGLLFGPRLGPKRPDQQKGDRHEKDGASSPHSLSLSHGPYKEDYDSIARGRPGHD